MKCVVMAVTIVAGLCTRVLRAQTARGSKRPMPGTRNSRGWSAVTTFPSRRSTSWRCGRKATFDPDEIDKELSWAEAMGMNTMRVFLHDLLWQQDAGGFQKRIHRFLTIASHHHIRHM